MRPLRKLAKFENDRRLGLLRTFRDRVQRYADVVTYGRFGGPAVENDKALELRRLINTDIPEVIAVVVASGESPLITFRSLTATGSMNVVRNVFNLADFEMTFQRVTDVMDTSIGRYDKNKRRALVNLFNPFFYLGLTLDYVASIPLRILARAHLIDRAKAEESFLWRVWKVLVDVVGFCASAVGVYAFFFGGG